MKRRPYKIPFTDNKGQTINLSSCMKLEELTKMGFSVTLAKPADPLPDGHFRENLPAVDADQKS